MPTLWTRARVMAAVTQFPATAASSKVPDMALPLRSPVGPAQEKA